MANIWQVIMRSRIPCLRLLQFATHCSKLFSIGRRTRASCIAFFMHACVSRKLQGEDREGKKNLLFVSEQRREPGRCSIKNYAAISLRLMLIAKRCDRCLTKISPPRTRKMPAFSQALVFSSLSFSGWEMVSELRAHKCGGDLLR